MLVSSRRKLTRVKLLRLLEEVEAAPGTAVSLYIPPGMSVSAIEKALDIV